MEAVKKEWNANKSATENMSQKMVVVVAVESVL